MYFGLRIPTILKESFNKQHSTHDFKIKVNEAYIRTVSPMAGLHVCDIHIHVDVSIVHTAYIVAKNHVPCNSNC